MRGSNEPKTVYYFKWISSFHLCTNIRQCFYVWPHTITVRRWIFSNRTITIVYSDFKTNGIILENFPCEKFRPPRGFEPTTSSIPGKCSTVSAIESCMSQKELTHIYISLSSTSPSSQTPSIIELNCLKGGLKWFVSAGWWSWWEWYIHLYISMGR